MAQIVKGIANLGITCYLNSILQALWCLNHFLEASLASEIIIKLKDPENAARRKVCRSFNLSYISWHLVHSLANLAFSILKALLSSFLIKYLTVMHASKNLEILMHIYYMTVYILHIITLVIALC